MKRTVRKYNHNCMLPQGENKEDEGEDIEVWDRKNKSFHIDDIKDLYNKLHFLFVDQ